MSLLINGMDMPKNCKRCPCLCDVGAGIYFCSAIKDIVHIEDISKRQSYCNASEIPTPHGRLIDADLLLTIMRKRLYGNPEFDYIIGLVERQRTIIEAED